MAFSGNLSMMGLSEVIAFLDRNGLQGALTVESPEVTVKVFVHDGRLLFPPLTDSGRLPIKALEAIQRRAKSLEAPKKKPKVIKPGQSGVISRSDLTDLLSRANTIERDRRRSKIEDSMHALFLLDDARFRFEPLCLPPARVKNLEAEGLVMDSKGLLLEVARRADEAKVRRKQRSKHRIDETASSSGTRVASRPSRRRKRKPKRKLSASSVGLSGELEGVGLGALLQDLRSNHRTGVLMMRGGGHIERLYFNDGAAFVLRAREGEDFAREFLGEGLAETISSMTPDADEEEARSSNDLKAGFWELLVCEGTRFEFMGGQLPREFHAPRPSIQKVALDTNRFLMQAIAHLDEWSAIKKVVGSPKAIYRFVNHDKKFLCVRQIAEFLMLVDGLLSFEAIVRKSGQPRMEVGRVFRSLISEGILQRVNPTRTARPLRRKKRRRKRRVS